MATTPTGLAVPAGTDPFDPDGDMRDLAASLEGRLVVPVPNVTARAALAAAVSPTPTEPLYVHRQDAPVGGRTEITEDGTNWRTLWTPDPTAQGLAGAANWDAGAEPPRFRAVGDQVVGSGLLVRVNNAITIGYAGETVGTIPAGLRPAENGSVLVPNTVATEFALEWRTTGALVLRRFVGGNVAIPAGGFFSLAPIRYTRA